MPEEKGDKVSFIDLLELTRLLHRLAELHCDYIKKGHTSEDIAELFAKLYHKEFRALLDEKTVLALRGELPLYGQINGSGTDRAAAIQICLKMALGFMRISTVKLRQDDDPQE